LSFIPLIIRSKNLFSSEASLKYFLTQALASTIFLFRIILILIFIDIKRNLIPFIIITTASAIILKIGAAPFHF
jgi:NADH-ubiquinone oxidoreductase chain 2